MRAEPVCGLDQRAGHCATTSVSVSGEYLPPEDQQAPAVPLTLTHGSSKAKRPALQRCVRSTLWVARAVPLWGKPEDGTASEHTGNPTLLANLATCLAQPGGAPGAAIAVAEAALVTEETLAALGATLCSTRLPAIDNAGGRSLAEAVAPNTWAALGVLAPPKPTPHRPAPA